MAALPLVLMAVGTAVTVAGQIQSANAAKTAADYNQKVGEQNAEAAEQQAQVQAQIASRQASQKQGLMLASYGANGIETGEGSPLEIMSQSAADAERDRQNITYNGEVKATSLRNGASLAAAQGDNAQTSGYLSAAGTIFGSASRYYGSGSGTSTLSAGTGYGTTLA